MRWLKKPLVAFGGLVGAIVIGVAVFVAQRHEPQIEEDISHPPPVLARADFDDGAYSDGATLVIPSRKASRALLHATYCQPLLDAARAAGGVHVSPLRLRIVLEGNTLRGVTITGMRARVVQRSMSLRGALTTCPGGGEVAVPKITFNLDSPNPIALVTGTQIPYFASHAINLAKGERQGLAVTGVTYRFAVRWLLVLDALIQRKRREIEVGLDQHPFQSRLGRCTPRAYSPYFDLDIDHGMVTRTYGSACSR